MYSGEEGLKFMKYFKGDASFQRLGTCPLYLQDILNTIIQSSLDITSDVSLQVFRLTLFSIFPYDNIF
jgi:hypothetical protein